MDEGLFERIWEYREETLYRRLFGDAARGIFVIPHEMFAKTFSQKDVDPRWLHHGVFEYAPTFTRSSWIYTTSGMSAPWEAEEPDPSAVSGLGCEFIFESSVRGDWAITRLLQLMAYQILLCTVAILAGNRSDCSIGYPFAAPSGTTNLRSNS